MSNSFSSSDNNDGAAAAASAGESDMIVAVLLQDFFDNNPPAVVASTSKILVKLLRNAASGNPKHATVRLTNPKIQQHIVQVSGALDVLGAAGFDRSAERGGEFLVFGGPTPAAAAAHDSSLIDSICHGLETRIAELEPPPAAAAAATKPSSSNDDEEFLSERERLRRVEKIKAQKRAQKAQREAAKRRWAEDMEEKKLAAQRREAALNNKMMSDVKDGDFQVHQDVRIIGKNNGEILPLAKPFEEAAPRKKEGVERIDSDPQAVRRQLIQECMKDPKLDSREKQRKIRELILNSDPVLAMAVSGDAAAASAGPSAETNEMATEDGPTKMPFVGTPKKDADQKMNDDDDKKPAAKKPSPPSQPALQPNSDLAKSRTFSLPSAEWTAFVERTPRCAGAEGIRDSSVFFKQSSSANFDTAIPKCLKRLFKELDGLKDDLPADPNCSIWLRFDEETPQYIRALVAAPLPGPTPYSGGLFAFDVYIPNDYPQTNPKVQLLTTGGGRVRFGPNLYADGKVCLSLLGTWPGPKWNPKHSSLYQVLISIQGLILGVEHPYFLEPGHGGWEGRVKEGDFQVTGQTLAGESVREELGVPLKVVLYEDVLRVGTARYAMVEPLKWALDEKRSTATGKTGLEAFGEIVRAHFCENRAAVVAEVRNWTSDHALGRNRSKALEESNLRYDQGVTGSRSKAGTLQIDALQSLLPKLEELLGKASALQIKSSTIESAPAAACADSMMDVEAESKPAAQEFNAPARLEDVSKFPAKPLEGKTEQQPDAGVAKQNKPASDTDAVEQKRQQMQEAAKDGDYILAGKIQEEVNRLEELRRSMQEAAEQGDFIRAGRLQAQFKALTEGAGAATSGKITAPKKANVGQPPSNPGWNDEMNDDWSEDGGEDENMDWGDDEMDEGGPPLGGSFPGPHGPGIYPPPGHLGHAKHSWGKHSWGAGHTLAAPAAAVLPAKATAVEEGGASKAAPQKVIPPNRLCRLRVRLPQDKSIVEDFDRDDSLAEVYRRLEGSISAGDGVDGSNDGRKAVVAMGGPSAPAGAFSQPLSSAGFTLLLARPKREFGLEMHGTKSLAELNLAPSATLTLMRCRERGVVCRGEVESRLEAAQGDAMDVEGLTYEGLVELTERVGRAAPKEGDAFLTLTAEEYEANTAEISPSAYLADLDSSNENGEEDRRCPICLGCYDGADSTQSLRVVKNCGHTMHAGCLQTWLRTNSSCPLCKAPVARDGKDEGGAP